MLTVWLNRLLTIFSIARLVLDFCKIQLYLIALYTVNQSFSKISVLGTNQTTYWPWLNCISSTQVTWFVDNGIFIIASEWSCFFVVFFASKKFSHVLQLVLQDKLFHFSFCLHFILWSAYSDNHDKFPDIERDVSEWTDVCWWTKRRQSLNLFNPIHVWWYLTSMKVG